MSKSVVRLCIVAFVAAISLPSVGQKRGESPHSREDKPNPTRSAEPDESGRVASEDPDLTRFRVVTTEGILAVFDAAEEWDGRDEPASQLAYWNDFATQQFFFFDQLLFTEDDVLQSIAAMVRDLAIDPALLFDEMPELSPLPEITLPGQWIPAHETVVLAVMNGGQAAQAEGETAGLIDPCAPGGICDPAVMASTGPIPGPVRGTPSDQLYAMASLGSRCRCPGGGGGPCCNDNNPCTIDTCNPCQHTPKVCPDPDPCTTGVCLLATGQCQTASYCSGQCCTEGEDAWCCGATQTCCLYYWVSSSTHSCCPATRPFCCNNGPGNTDCCESAGDCCNGKCKDPNVTCPTHCCSYGWETAPTCAPQGCGDYQVLCNGACCGESPCRPGECVDGACVIGNACDDDDPCTEDLCTLADCQSISCENNPSSGANCDDDADPCTFDICDSGECTHPPKCPEQECCNGVCCGAGESCCAGECALPECCIDGRECCNDPSPCCNVPDPCCEDECDEGESCCGRACCSNDQPCCDGVCCADEEHCGETVNAVCCNGGCCAGECCEDECCSPNESCTSCGCCAGNCCDGTCCNGTCHSYLSCPSEGSCQTVHLCCYDGNPCTLDQAICGDEECTFKICAYLPLCDDGIACTNDECIVEECSSPTCENNWCGAATECETVYILPNDVVEVEFEPPPDTGDTFYLSIADPAIAKFRVNEELFSSIQITGPPFAVDVHGLSVGETMLNIHQGSSTGTKVLCKPIKVGGSIIFDFDQLPTYRPYEDLNRIAGNPPYVTQDIQVGNLSIMEIGNFAIPAHIDDLVQSFPKAGMIARMTVLDADGAAMYAKAVVLKQIFTSEFPNANALTIAQNSNTTDADGAVTATVQVAQPNGYLDRLEKFRLLVLVGRLAEHEQQGVLPENVARALADDYEVPLETFTTNGSYIRLEKRFSEPGIGGVEAVMAIRSDFLSIRAEAIAREFFENVFGRQDVSLSLPSFPEPASQIWDLFTASNAPLVLTSELLDPVTIDFPLPQVGRPLDVLTGADITALMTHLLGEGRYRPAKFSPLPSDAQLFGDIESAITLTSSLYISMIPIVGNVKDIVTAAWDWWVGEEVDYLSVIVSVVTLPGDIGAYSGVGSLVAAPVVLIGTMAKGAVKLTPKLVFKASVAAGGGGIRGLFKLKSYLSLFLKEFDWLSPSDWGNLTKWRSVLTKYGVHQRILRDSPLVRAGAATAEQIADCAGQAVAILGERARLLTERAVEGIAALIRHGNGGVGGADVMRDLIAKFPANVADDCTESVSEAISKTYRRAPNASGFPAPEDLRRVDDALLMGRAAPAGYEGVLNSLLGEGHVIKSLEEWNALKSMPAEAIKPEQVTAIKLITDQLWNIEVGTSITRIVPIDGTFGGTDIVQNGIGTLANFFARTSDVFDATTTPQLINRLRLDTPPWNLQPNSAYARLRTIANDDIVTKSRLPRHAGFTSGHPKEEILEDLPYPQGYVYPFSGKGVPASLDGHTLPEMKIAQGQSATMTAGVDAAQQPVTVLEFRFADGRPYPQTIGGVTASDWKLSELVPGDPSQGHEWLPCPINGCN